MKAKFVKSVLVIALLTVGANLMAADPRPVVQEQTWTVNFKDTDIVDVVKFISEVTGKTIIVDPKVRGPVKVISNKQLNKKELYELFLAVLDIYQFTAVENDGVVRIIANRDARSAPIPTEQKIVSRDDGYITQIIQLNNISASKVLAAIRPLVPQYGHLTAYEPSNALIISDTRANIARINELIAQMDKAAVLTTDVLQLHYAQATEVVSMINTLEKPDTNRGATTSPPIVVADKRINAVIVSGDEMSRQRIKGLVENLDRPQARNANLKVVYLSYAKAADVAKVLTGMLQAQGGGKTAEGAAPGSQANVQADESTNSVLITADGDVLQSLMAVVESLDIRRAQVLVEAIIVDVTDSTGKQLGVQWMFRDKENGFGGSSDGSGKMATIGAGAVDLTDKGLTTLAAGIAGLEGQTFGIGRLGNSGDFLGLLTMLQKNSGANVLSTPNLLTTDNTKATISVGQKIPFKTGSYSGTTSGNTTTGITSPFNTINRESVGVKLEVTPHINEGDSIILDIKQEVSGIADKNNIDGPITDERKIETQILASDGQTVVLGGLIRDEVQAGSVRVPLLGSIPLIGKLFRTQTNSKVKTNLLVFIRASVLRDNKMLEGATAEKYQAIRDLQLDARRKEGSKVIPVLPEWKAGVDPVAPDQQPAALESQPATESPATENRVQPVESKPLPGNGE